MNRTGGSKCFEMVRVNNYENQTDDSKDREREADINDTWKVKWIGVNGQFNIGVNEALRTMSNSKTSGLTDSEDRLLML